MMLNPETCFEDIRDFNATFGHNPDAETQWRLVVEESQEFIEAAMIMHGVTSTETCGNFLKEAADLTYVLAGLAVICEDHATDPDVEARLLAAMDEPSGAVVDTATRILGKAHDAFLTDTMMQEAWAIVHNSNMSKVGEDGVVRISSEGKVLKPDTYVAPDMSELGASLKVVYQAAIDEMEEAA